MPNNDSKFINIDKNWKTGPREGKITDFYDLDESKFLGKGGFGKVSRVFY